MISTNKSLQIALIISAIVHGGIVFLPNLNFISSLKAIKNTELTYLKTKTDGTVIPKEKSIKRDIRFKLSPPQWQKSNYKSIQPRQLSAPFINDKVFKKKDEFLLNKPQLPKPDIIAIKKSIALTPVELKRISNPSYISYYQIVREKIRRCAYQNYATQDTGEVYLSFVVSSNGNLTQARVIEEKSTPNYYLKEIAIKSLKDASSFPIFPKDLNYPELTFNVIISFEIE